ncbi:MarR family winged helix-turn-helix transcriptional regulator [Marinactinospora thermotolerans]|uniref:DNA-binding transcriptional regulator, MarR family n=1 Tax=Marinactinospora thermotolerans DSM 45154 TaxID=1122192 RepID=A0A1T4PSC8_9ACTN|nr:MarR family transcriptional regulator [Marinactinospora thermotolerans]SJZ94554.1 DNA-binding transcriptional regulator, MarR family [Marinactinospora thermotolerans DSM 45154]
MSDTVARFSAQWRERRPDLDYSGMEVVGRVIRLTALISQIIDGPLAEAGLSRPEFEVLSALRRTGQGLRPSQLTRETLSSGAATTKRLARLEGEGLVTRTTSTRDRREVDVHLTDAGRALVDRLLPQRLRAEAELLESLSPEERRHLGALLAKVLSPLEGAPRA